MVRSVGPDRFPIRRGDNIRLVIADLILGRRLVEQFANYLYDQGVASTRRHVHTYGPRSNGGEPGG